MDGEVGRVTILGDEAIGREQIVKSQTRAMMTTELIPSMPNELFNT